MCPVIGPARARSRSGRSSGLGSLLMVAAACLVAPTARAAEFPQVTAGLGWGRAGLFHEESLAGALERREFGRFSGSGYWIDGAYRWRSNFTLGLRAQYLRVPLSAGTQIGHLDLLPAVVCLGYRHASAAGRLHPFVMVGAGLASARFRPSAGARDWEAPDGGELRVSARRPGALLLAAGGDVTLTENLSLEAGFSSMLMSTEVSYRPAGQSGEDDALSPSCRVSGRHLLLTLGLRWWVELW